LNDCFRLLTAFLTIESERLAICVSRQRLTPDESRFSPAVPETINAMSVGINRRIKSKHSMGRDALRESYAAGCGPIRDRWLKDWDCWT